MSLNVKLSANPIKYSTKAFEIGKDRIYTTNKARFSQSTHPLATLNASTSSILNLNSENNRNCLMQLLPEQQPLSTLESGLAKCIETLKDKMVSLEDNITAILVGGKYSANAESFNLFNEIANILDKFEIPFSMICGKYDNIASDNIVTTGNIVRIWNSSLKDLNIPSETSGDDLKKILEKNYEVVEFSEDVPVVYKD